MGISHSPTNPISNNLLKQLMPHTKLLFTPPRKSTVLHVITPPGSTTLTSRTSVGSARSSNVHARLAIVAGTAWSADCCQTRSVTVRPSITRFALSRVHEQLHVAVRSTWTQRHVEACASLTHATLGTGVSTVLVDAVVARRAGVTGTSLSVVHVRA